MILSHTVSHLPGHHDLLCWMTSPLHMPLPTTEKGAVILPAEFLILASLDSWLPHGLMAELRSLPPPPRHLGYMLSCLQLPLSPTQPRIHPVCRLGGSSSQFSVRSPSLLRCILSLSCLIYCCGRSLHGALTDTRSTWKELSPMLTCRLCLTLPCRKDSQTLSVCAPEFKTQSSRWQ